MSGKRFGLGGRIRVAVIVALAFALAGGLLSAVGLASNTASLQAPIFGQSVNLVPVSGKVFVTVSGNPRVLLSAPRQVPVGSVVDVSTGSVQLTAADSNGAPPYSGTFSQGEFEVLQSSSGGGTTQIVLLGACTQAHTAGDRPTATVARPPHSHVRRFLQITADGKFVIVGANGTASETGPAVWVVNDNCDGSTSVVDHKGTVEQTSRAAHLTQLGPGYLGELYCQPPKGPLKFCQVVVSGPDTNYGHFELGLFHHREPSYTVCLSRHGRTVRCDVAKFKQSPSGSATTVLLCHLNTLPRGTYETRFLVRGAQIGIQLPFTTDHTFPLVGALGSHCETFLF